MLRRLSHRACWFRDPVSWRRPEGSGRLAPTLGKLALRDSRRSKGHRRKLFRLTGFCICSMSGRWPSTTWQHSRPTGRQRLSISILSVRVMACPICIAWPRSSRQATGSGFTNQAPGGSPGVVVGGMGLAGLIRITLIWLHGGYTNARRQKARPCEPGYLLDFLGGSGEARTHDQWIKSPVLYRLSYRPPRRAEL